MPILVYDAVVACNGLLYFNSEKNPKLVAFKDSLLLAVAFALKSTAVFDSRYPKYQILYLQLCGVGVIVTFA